jgi:hypothetical protein
MIPIDLTVETWKKIRQIRRRLGMKTDNDVVIYLIGERGNMLNGRNTRTGENLLGKRDGQDTGHVYSERI